jgi:hypothetical protein
MTLPVIFIHQGYNEVIGCAVGQAAMWNDQVVIVGDASLSRLGSMDGRVRVLPLEQLGAGIEQFGAVYQHMHPRNDGFEQFCFTRWFVLRNVMAHLNAEVAFYADSDVMLFASMAQRWAADFAGADCAYAIPYIEPMPYPWAACGHCSFWTRQGIDDLCRFTIECYTEPALLGQLRAKWSSHVLGQVAGGICDMTTMWLHYQSGRFAVANVLTPMRGHVFDHNIALPHNLLANEFEMNGPIKRVQFDSAGVPHGWRVAGGELLAFDALHFQGGAKVLMPQCLALGRREG